MNIEVVSRNQVVFNGRTYSVALGKNGVVSAERKIEGDLKTPRGRFSIRKIYYRSDRVSKPLSSLPVEKITPRDAWCDDPADSENYNRYVTLPHKGSYERLWRDDQLYDYLAVLGYNDNPPHPGKGSAIFMHVARSNYSPTSGCIAFSRDDIETILNLVSKASKVIV